MTLIDGDRIITAQLYDEQHEEFTEKKMSIIDYVNAYTDEGVTEADVVEQTRWIPVSERLPEYGELVLFRTKTDRVFEGRYFADNTDRHWYAFCDEAFVCNNVVTAWMPLPEPYNTESEDKEWD